MSRGHGVWVDRLLCAAAVALSAAVVYTGKSVTTSEIRARENNVLSAWRREELTSILIEGQSKAGQPERVRLELDDSKGDAQKLWAIREPFLAPADPQAVDDLLNALRFAIWVRKLDATADTGGFGFSAPRRSLELRMGELGYRINLGKPAPAPQGAAYLEVVGPDEKTRSVGIVKAEVATALLLDTREFLGRAFAPYARSEVKRLELDGLGGTRRLVRDAHRFRFDGMLHDQLVDGQALEPLFFHLARLNAEHFIAPKLAERALTGPDTVRLKLWTSNAKQEPSVELAIGGKCPDEASLVVVARKKPRALAACVAANVMAGLTLEADRLIDLTPFSFSVDSVERIQTELGSLRLELVRDNEGFLLKAPLQTRVPLDQGNSRVESIVNTKAEPVERPDLKSLGLDPARGSMTIVGLSEVTNSAVEEQVRIGTVARDGKLPILRKADGRVFLVSPEAARAFRVDATLSKHLELFDFSADDLVSLDLESRALSQKLVRRAEQLELVVPEGFQADATLVSAFTHALQDLKAERWISDETDASFGLDQPAFELKFTIKRKQERTEMTLKVGGRIPGGAYASLSHLPGVFVLSTEALRLLTTPVLSRAAFVFDPNECQKVVFETRERRITLRKLGASFVSENTGVDAAHVARMLDALEKLRPEFALHTGPAAATEGFQKPNLKIVCEKPAGSNIEISLGREHTFPELSGYFARATGSNASFAMSQGRAQDLMDLL